MPLLMPQESSFSTHFPSSVIFTSHFHFPLSIHKSPKKLSHHLTWTSPLTSKW